LSSLFIFSPPLYIFNIIFSTWGTSAKTILSFANFLQNTPLEMFPKWLSRQMQRSNLHNQL
ncbi:MAG: hypothetical protein K6U11_10495, partial [bacterium]|nr:hypothetical protein [bacterium]